MADVRDERKEKKKSYHSEITTVSIFSFLKKYLFLFMYVAEPGFSCIQDLA